MDDLKLKAIINKTKALEDKFWEQYQDENNMPNDLLDLAIKIIRSQRNIIIELNRENAELKEKVVEQYEYELKDKEV